MARPPARNETVSCHPEA